MSEYQYYEFLAIDRPLTPAQIAKVREFSTRAEITATSFVNEYHWGSFKGDPHEFLKRYYDAMIYLANWGTRRFLFRAPKDLIDRNAVSPYLTEETLTITPGGDYLIFSMLLQEEAGDRWTEDGSGWMASLAGLRAEVMAGDRRPLYLAWLLEQQFAGYEGEDEEADAQLEYVATYREEQRERDKQSEPPVPPGLKQLSSAQKSFVEFFGVDEELLEIAAAESPAMLVDEMDLATTLGRAPAAEKDRWLLEILSTEDPHAAMRLRLKLQAMNAADQPTPPVRQSSRTIGDLRAAWGQLAEERKRKKREAAAAERARKAAKAAAEREAYLDELARNVDATWTKIDQLIAMRTPTVYRQAVDLLKDLKALSERPGGEVQSFQRRLNERKATHAKKGNLQKLIQQAKL
jgi:hypothetical protein